MEENRGGVYLVSFVSQFIVVLELCPGILIGNSERMG
jgi:hypothetical protein